MVGWTPKITSSFSSTPSIPAPIWHSCSWPHTTRSIATGLLGSTRSWIDLALAAVAPASLQSAEQIGPSGREGREQAEIARAGARTRKGCALVTAGRLGSFLVQGEQVEPV